jgi:hypothetical protein
MPQPRLVLNTENGSKSHTNHQETKRLDEFIAKQPQARHQELTEGKSGTLPVPRTCVATSNLSFPSNNVMVMHSCCISFKADHVEMVVMKLINQNF